MKKLIFISVLATFFLIPGKSNSLPKYGINEDWTKPLIPFWEPDTLPPIKPVDPELGNGTCLTDRNWKRRDMIEDHYMFFANPDEVTIENCDRAVFKPSTPYQILRIYNDAMYQINIEYQRCVAGSRP
ncbi:MAG: hypothetical protein ACRDD6_13280 [Tannerellaceae bacterium]